MDPGLFQKLKLFPVNSRPYGLTYEQWSAKWWTWLLRIPKHNSPVYDETGVNAYFGQVDPNVFFLCQTFNQNASTPSRRVIVQRGRSLFLPLINWISTAPEDGITDDDLILKAQLKMNSIGDLKIVFNGNQIIKDFSQYRIQTRPFYVHLPNHNILGLNSGSKRLASDGFWILTDPILRPFCLTTFGSCSAGLTKIGVDYEITVT